MYTGQIYNNDIPVTVQEAVDLGLVSVDENGDIWLASDTSHLIKIIGDLKIGN